MSMQEPEPTPATSVATSERESQNPRKHLRAQTQGKQHLESANTFKDGDSRFSQAPCSV